MMRVPSLMNRSSACTRRPSILLFFIVSNVLEVRPPFHIEQYHLHACGTDHCIEPAEKILVGWIRRPPKDPDLGHGGNRFFQQFQLLAGKVLRLIYQAGRVTRWAREALNESRAYHVAGPGEYDRNSRCCVPCCDCRRSARSGKDNVDFGAG